MLNPFMLVETSLEVVALVLVETVLDEVSMLGKPSVL